MKSKLFLPLVILLVVAVGAIAQFTVMDSSAYLYQRVSTQLSFGEQISQLATAHEAGTLTDEEFRMLRSMLIEAMVH